MTEIEQQAVHILARLAPIRNISDFGCALLHSGAMQVNEGKKYSRQGYALLAGRWLRRLESLGLAVDGYDGWRPMRSNT